MWIDGSWELRSIWSLRKEIAIDCHSMPSQSWHWCLCPSPCLLTFYPHDSVPCLYSPELESIWFPFSNSFPFSYFLVMLYSSCQIFHPFFFPHRCCMSFPSTWVVLSHEILVTRIILSRALIHHKKFYTYCVKSTFTQGSKNLCMKKKECKNRKMGSAMNSCHLDIACLMHPRTSKSERPVQSDLEFSMLYKVCSVFSIRVSLTRCTQELPKAGPIVAPSQVEPGTLASIEELNC